MHVLRLVNSGRAFALCIRTLVACVPACAAFCWGRDEAELLEACGAGGFSWTYEHAPSKQTYEPKVATRRKRSEAIRASLQAVCALQQAAKDGQKQAWTASVSFRHAPAKPLCECHYAPRVTLRHGSEQSSSVDHKPKKSSAFAAKYSPRSRPPSAWPRLGMPTLG